MSTIAAIVRVRVLTSAAVVANNLLGSSPTRLFHLVAPQNTKRPWAVYGTDDGAPEHNLAGASGLWQGRVSLDIYADQVSAMEQIVEQVRLTCDGYRGDVTVDSVVYSVRKCFLVAQTEDVVYLDPGKPNPTFRAGLSLDISATQSIPTF